MPRPSRAPTRRAAAVCAAVTVVSTLLGVTATDAVAAPREPRTDASAAVTAPAVPAAPGAARKVPAPPGASPLAAIVVKIASGHTVEELTSAYPVVVEDTVLASRGIYLMRATESNARNSPRGARELADTLARSAAVDYAEQNYAIELTDDRFHAWSDGSAEDAGEDIAAFTGQAAATRLRLAEAHAITTGAGQTIAVLDTGVDRSHPALASKVAAGWDYVDDDADPSEASYGDASGHGTFVAGLASLVAPGAKIRAYRVLDRHGNGSIFAVTQGILDADADGASVVNLSLGVAGKIESKALNDAVRQARAKRVLIISAAGNDGSKTVEQYPAASPDAVGVTALAADGDELASFANSGPWVDIAAPGDAVVGPMPDGHYAAWAGTSMATPLVAGQVALLRSRSPGLDARQLTDRLLRSSGRLTGRYAFGSAAPFASLQGP